MYLRICLLLVGLLFGRPIWAGDEDVAPRPRQVVEEQQEPEPITEPQEEFPDLSLGEEEPAAAPEVAPTVTPTPQQPRRQTTRRAIVPRRTKTTSLDPDENLNTSRTLDWVRRAPLPDGVSRPALGTRGYRSSMIAVGAGDRTPGYGLQVEHSFNRLGVGASASYLSLTGDLRSKSYSFYNLYGIYRWLPYSVSPYLHGGVQYGIATPISFGLLGGVGIEARVYDQWTLLIGYTYHSVAEKGYFGGAVGWIF